MSTDNRPFTRYLGENELTVPEFRVWLKELQFDQGWEPDHIVIHHTFSPVLKEWRGKNAAGKIPSLDALERFYHDVDHWHGGPHFFVSDIHWYMFNDPRKRGVHAVSFNKNAWGIEVIHNGDDIPFPPDQSRTLYQGVASMLQKIGGMLPGTIEFHRDDPTTVKTCPGLKVTKASVLNGVMHELAVLSGHDTATHGVFAPFDAHPEDASDVAIVINNRAVAFTGHRVDGVTYVKLHDLAPALSATLDYRKPTGYGQRPILAVVRGAQRVDLTGRVEITNGTAWVSVHALCDALGDTVTWNGRQVLIHRA